jgi:hypothetical protein
MLSVVGLMAGIHMNILIKRTLSERGNTMRKIILALIFVIATASFAFADTIVLRDGRTIRGTVLGFVSGRFVVRVWNRSTNQSDEQFPRNREGEIQYFRPNEIDRIEIEGRSLDEARFETRTVQVTLDPNWVDSNVDLRRGERVKIDASGVITTGRMRITPDGVQRTDPTAPLPNAKEGELIGAVGDDAGAPIIELGSTREFTADRDGRLYLTANRGSYSDARGSFSVQIRRERDLNAIDNPEGYPRNPGRGRGRSRSRQPIENIPREVTINVPGTSRGTDTGIDVRAGDPITLTATGVVIAGRRVGEVGPEGARSSGLGINVRPVPTAGVGALIAYIRDLNGQLSQAYLIGNQLTTTVPVNGRLILAINDDDYSDNGGSFTVRIRY